MKKNFLKFSSILFIALFFLSIMSSCNRGYGCPNQFKAQKVVNNI